jgi:hypothetical protein
MRISRGMSSVMGPSELGCPSALNTGIGRANLVVLRPSHWTYLMSMQEPSQPLSSSALASCSARVSRAMMLALKLSFDPLVPRIQTRGSFNSSTASTASPSFNLLMTSMVCQLISIWRLGCAQFRSMGIACSSG